MCQRMSFMGNAFDAFHPPVASSIRLFGAQTLWNQAGKSYFVCSHGCKFAAGSTFGVALPETKKSKETNENEL